MAFSHIKDTAGVLHPIEIPVAQISDLNVTATEINYLEGVSSNIQTQLNNKKYWANVELSGSSSVTTKPTFAPDFLVNIPAGTAVTGSYNGAWSSPIPKYLWHDLFAFGINGHPTVSISADGGTTWETSTDDTLRKKLFIQREDQTVTVLNDSKTAIRWQWYSSQFHACQAKYLNIGFAYSASQATFNILFETSKDGVTWSSGFSKTGVRYNSAPYWFYITSGFSSEYYVRLTLTRTSGSGTSANISGIKLLTTRWGNQGRGAEYEHPYSWDENQNLFPRSNNSVTLGTSSARWSKVYATEFDGIATKAKNDENGNNIADTYATKSMAVAANEDGTGGSNGLMSALDKRHHDIMWSFWEDDDENNVVDKIEEVLQILTEYPEGVSIAEALNGKAPTDHASADTKYGIASASQYGHAKASSATPLINISGGAVGTDNGIFARGDHQHPLQTSVSGNAGSSDKWLTPIDVNFTGDAEGTLENLDGSSNTSVSLTIKDSDKVDGKDADDFAYQDEGLLYVEGTGTTAGTWLGSNSRITSYYDGLTILYKINIAGASTTTLNINDLGAKTIYRAGSTKLTTHHPVNSVILLTYLEDLNNGCWMDLNSYDSNTLDQLRPSYSRFYTADALYDYKICGVDKDGRLRPLTITTGTGTTKTVNTAPIRPNEFYYYNTTTDVAAGGIVGANNIYSAYSHTTLHYTLNSTGTAYREVYLKGSFDASTGLFSLDTSSATSWYVLVPYNTANITLTDYFTKDSYYILLARTYSTNNYFSLLQNHPFYKFNGSNLVEVSGYAENAASANTFGGKTADAYALIANTYTKTEVDNLVAPAVVLKGTLGTGGTKTSLPTASKDTLGDMYKVITAGTYANQSAKVGDSFICYTTDNENYQWALIPSGDSDTDTWRTIKVDGTIILNSGTSTSALDLKSGSNVSLTTSGGAVTIAVPIKTINTNNSTAQAVNSSEAIAGTGAINLHKVSKTGAYSDLIGAPEIPNPTDYYWANIKVSSSSSTTTAPTFDSVNITSAVTMKYDSSYKALKFVFN